MGIIEIIGWIGSGCYSICTIPQCIAVWRDKKNASGLSWSFLLLWVTGAAASLLYLILSTYATGLPLPLIVNFVFNLTSVAYLIYGKKKSQ